MKNSRLLAFALGILFAPACQSTDTEAKDLQLGLCCAGAMELVEQMPECCQSGISVAGDLSGCCEKGMLETTADADRPACCKKSLQLMEGFQPCCKDTVYTGEPGACCASMPDALAQNG